MAPIPSQVGGRKFIGKWTSLQFLCLTTVSFGFLKVVEVSGWTYHYSTEMLTWNQSYHWCKSNFTDMVAIQNKEEISFLTDYLPGGDSHYWIGLRKINNIWVWIGTNKSLTQQEENWAQFEPNNKKNNQDCVEIYIKRSHETGKWNDEPCTRKKKALCYLVSCSDSSCNNHGDCMETIQNYTCKCWLGFYGANCENAISCRSLQIPSHGQMVCSDTLGTFQYNSVCNFSCEEGFQMTGTRSLSCQDSGNWSESIPTCKAVSCSALENPSQSHMNCSHTFGAYKFRSICEFTCKDGFQLKGSNFLLCQHSGEWSEPVPKCIAVPCTALQGPEHGKVNCSDPFGAFRYTSMCNVTCEEGFDLQGTSSLWCQDTGEWSDPIPTCAAVSCSALENPSQSHMNCSHTFGEYKFRSICEFTCKDGFQLKGSNFLLCQHSGEWSEPVPKCIAVPCTALQGPEHGKVNCSDPFGAFRYTSMCNVTCEEGFELQGTSSLWCQDTGEWSDPIPTCAAQNDPPETQTQVNPASYVIPSLGLMLSGMAVAYGINYYRKKKNPGLLKSEIENINTFDNPAFEDTNRPIDL
ncbi:P-selectin-like isoform X2 [Hyla sarda]|uniref:P-selectin-like isoform X2 n=1 Tax=Hyla sarda TaxID=327740 RepID=UPI0024C2EEE8|nr:P-selectin-like isoform X2 [Hyla sarda]